MNAVDSPGPRAQPEPRGRRVDSPSRVAQRFAPPSSPLWAVAGLTAALALFAVLKLYGVHFVRGDEHLYYYMSLLILDGLVPYRDFHHSHPPLPIYVNAAIFAVVGFSLFAAKLVPMLAAASSAVHVYLLGRRGFGAAEGLIAALLFLFSFDVLRGSNHATGANLALAFMLAATYQALRRRPAAGGALLGLGALCGVYVVPLFLMIAVLTLLRSWRDALRLTAAFALVYATVLGGFLAASGAAIIDQVFVFNWRRAPMPYAWWEKFGHVFYLNLPLMIGFVPGIAWGVARWALGGRARGAVELEPRLPAWLARFARWLAPWSGDRLGFALLMAIFAGGYLFFYANLEVYFSYYFMLVMRRWMMGLPASRTRRRMRSDRRPAGVRWGFPWSSRPWRWRVRCAMRTGSRHSALNREATAAGGTPLCRRRT